MHVTAIIAAGGRGQRFGGAQPKQLLSVGGRPILERSVVAFASHPVGRRARRRAAAGAWRRSARVSARDGQAAAHRGGRRAAAGLGGQRVSRRRRSRRDHRDSRRGAPVRERGSDRSARSRRRPNRARRSRRARARHREAAWAGFGPARSTYAAARDDLSGADAAGVPARRAARRARARRARSRRRDRRGGAGRARRAAGAARRRRSVEHQDHDAGRSGDGRGDRASGRSRRRRARRGSRPPHGRVPAPVTTCIVSSPAGR